MENCPDCGAHLSGGWIQRTREVIELPVVPVQVTEHVYIARTCPACRRRCTPPAVLDGVVLGQQRLGVNLLSLIVTVQSWWVELGESGFPDAGAGGGGCVIH